MGASASDIKAGGAFVEVNADTTQAKKNLTGFGAALQDLKKGLGEESKFGGLFKILAGTGAVAGLALAGRLLSEATSKSVDLSNQFRDGKISAGEMAEGLVESLPILGDIFKAGKDIREMWTGEKRAIRLATEAAEEHDRTVAAGRKIIEESTASWLKQRDAIADMAGELDALSRRGLDRSVTTERNAAGARERGFRQSAKEDIDKWKADAATKKAPLNAKLQTAQTLGATKSIEELNSQIGLIEKNLQRAVSERTATLLEQVALNAAGSLAKQNEQYEEERKRLRDANAEREQTISGIKAETAAIDAQTSVTQQLTDAEQTHSDRLKEAADIERDLTESKLKARIDAMKEIEQLSSNDDSSAGLRFNQLQEEIQAYEDLADAKNRASGQTAARGQLDNFFSPIEDAFDSATSGGIMSRLDDFFGPIEDAYDELKSRIWGAQSSSFGTFSASEAAGGLGSNVSQAILDTAKYAKLQYDWDRTQAGGPTFR